MTQPVRVGVIGAGAVAVGRHLPAYAEARTAGGAEIVAVCDVDPVRAAAAAAAFGIPAVDTDDRALLGRPEVEAVSICTPNALHYTAAMAALAAGKHVLCEKPLAMTLPEARAMAALAAERGLVTVVNFRYRWIPAARFVTDLVAAGALGRLYHGVFHYFTGWLADPATPGAWRTSRALAGSGALGDLGSHLIDLAGSWLGDARRVQGHLTTYVAERPAPGGGLAPVDVDDAAGFTVEYASGAVGQFLVSRCTPGRTNYQRVELYGSGGAVSYEFDKWDRGGDTVQLCLGGVQARYGGLAPVQVTPEHLQGTPHGPLLEFIAAIREGRAARPDFAAGLACQEIIAAVERSAAHGRAVDLPLEHT
jgi:predicted dehydrogenase